jgi:pSer/pThr/pTyr-binding forkhead associated (FHA) protein
MDEFCPVCGTKRENNQNACASCGFHYSEATQKFAPVAVENVQALPATPTKKASLHVVRGPQSGCVYELTRTVSSVGRSPQCDIFLNDMTVSREHALIAATENGYVITDTNSYNGLWVNNKAVDRVLLKNGDTVQIGTFCLIFES